MSYDWERRPQGLWSGDGAYEGVEEYPESASINAKDLMMKLGPKDLPDGCRCSELDFHRILDEGGSEIIVCTVEHAKQCIDCPLCKEICRLSSDSPNSYWCQVRRVVATADEFPQRMATDPYARILLTIRDYSSTGGTSMFLDVVGICSSRAKQSGKSTIYRRSIGRTFDPDLLRGWLLACDARETSKQQAQCTRQIAPFEQLLATGKFRVADVFQGTIVTFTKPVRFLALSYVWGKSMTHYAATTTNSHNSTGADTFPDRIDWSEVPLTLSDAAELTRVIGERYLWIDSLCINQSDSEEKGLLISQMASIFANAYLTIVAADGRGADAGLSRLKGKHSAEEHSISFTAAGRPISLLPSRSSDRRAIMHSYWSYRGWTLQERLLSRRCVFFTNEQVYFQDAEVQVSETYDVYTPAASTALRKHAHNNESFDIVGDLYFRIFEKKGLGLGIYDQTIREYSTRILSHVGDRFDAFMGISEFFQPPGLPLDHITALNALPLKYFTNALRWKHYNAAPKRIRLDARKSRYLPSWSWVGWDGEVAGPFHFDPFVNAATVIDAANILCNICQPPDDFESDICQASQPVQVTLHLYAPSTPCQLFPTSNDEYIIGFNFSGSQPDCPMQLKDSIKLHQKPQADWLFKLVLMRRERSNNQNEFWLVRVDQPFAERIAFVEAVWDEGDLYKCLKGTYFRVR